MNPLLLYQLEHMELDTSAKIAELLYKICEDFDIALMDLIDFIDTLRPEIMEDETEETTQDW